MNILEIHKKYKMIKKKYEDCIVLFRYKDNYVTFDIDAFNLSNLLAIETSKQSSIRLLTFPYQKLDEYLPKMIKQGLRVAVCDLLEK